MDKAHYIARYGEEGYKEYLKKCGKTKKRQREGYPSFKPVNDVTVKVSVQADLDMDQYERLEQQEKIGGKLQRRLIGWWKSKTTKPFILVVDCGNLDKGTSHFSYKINLTQLDLKEEEIKAFQDGVVKEANDFLNK